MKNNSRKLLKAGIVMCLAALFVGTSTAAMVQPTNMLVASTKATTGIQQSTRDQIELHYYDPNTLSSVVGIQGGTPPYHWKTAIRLTQDELSPYMNWNITQVVVGFGEDYAEGPMNVTIIIYAKGTATHPGSVIVQDTWAILNGTALITVPLKTPVSLSVSGRDEVWVAISYTQNVDMTHYAFIDAGPHVEGKGDWTYLNNVWQSLYAGSQGTIDGNWAIGAIVEGQGLATLAIANIKGPTGIKADVQNTGDVDATSVVWSIAVKGGILGMINRTASGTEATIAAHGTLAVSVPMFFGLGKISIVIKAKAQNAQEITASKSAFVLGPLVIGIK
jgi:hypothetical protein